MYRKNENLEFLQIASKRLLCMTVRLVAFNFFKRGLYKSIITFAMHIPFKSPGLGIKQIPEYKSKTQFYKEIYKENYTLLHSFHPNPVQYSQIP